MPRRKKGKASRERSRRLDESKARFWRDRIAAAKQAKEDFTGRGEEVDDFFKSRHAKLFRDTSSFMSFEGAAAVSVPKSAQVRGSLGPHLYPRNPKRNVNPKGHDGVLLGLSRALSTYINKTPREGKIAREARKSIDDSLLRGRGFMRTGYDKRHEIVTSWFVSSRDVLIDPDVSEWQDAEWIAIRSVRPLWRVKRDIPEKWRKRDLRPNYGSTYSGDGDGAEVPERENDKAPVSNDLLECWEVYSKMGDGRRGSGFGGRQGHQDDGGEDFVKLLIATNHGVPLFEGEWESPLYLDNEWPIEPIDFVETLDELWPESVMSQVMPLQKAMDLLTSIELGSCKQRGRFLLFCDAEISQEAKQLIKSGPQSVIIPIKRKSQDQRPLSQLLHVAQMGNMPLDIPQARAFLEEQFERTTGLTQVVVGGSDGAKDRSATASRQRSEAANARLGDMRARVEEWATSVARHEALVTRLELDAEEVRPYVSPFDIDMYRVTITPSQELQGLYGVKEIPLRTGKLSMQKVAPGAATYFRTDQEAAEAMINALKEIAEHADVSYDCFRLAQDLDNTGNGLDVEQLFLTDPETGEVNLNLPEGVSTRLVTVEDVWRDTAGISPEELCRELGYEIASGSMQKFDKGREIETAELELQNVGPVALQTGNIDLYNAIRRRVDDAHEVPEDKRLPPLQPPPPMPEPQGASK